MARPKKYKISLTDDELKMLKSVIHKKKTTKTVRNRCQIIIDLDEAHGKILTHEQSAKTNCVCMATITNTVKLYSEKGTEGHSRWTLRLLEEQAKIVLDTPVSKDTIGRALKKINPDLT